MKKITLLILSILLMGCSKKIHHLVSTNVLKQTKSATDSIGQTKNATIDKSIISTSKDVDTTIIVPANALTGYVNFNNTDSLSNTNFDNDDFNLYIQTNRKTGVVKAIVLPKPKKVNVKIHEQTTTHNNIERTIIERSKSSSKLETKTDSVKTHVEDHSEPTSIFNYKIIIWISLATVLIGVIYYMVKNASIITLVKNLIKRIL